MTETIKFTCSCSCKAIGNCKAKYAAGHEIDSIAYGVLAGSAIPKGSIKAWMIEFDNSFKRRGFTVIFLSF
ncbi:MAG: hypothetical protein ABIN97_05155 [Ginsengibacter sp.]